MKPLFRLFHPRHKTCMALVQAGIAVFAVLTLGLPALRASAHANLIHSDPPQGAALSRPPSLVVLEFSESLDPGFTSVELLNGNGEVVISGPGQIDPAQPKVLRLRLDTIPD